MSFPPGLHLCAWGNVAVYEVKPRRDYCWLKTISNPPLVRKSSRISERRTPLVAVFLHLFINCWSEVCKLHVYTSLTTVLYTRLLNRLKNKKQQVYKTGPWHCGGQVLSAQAYVGPLRLINHTYLTGCSPRSPRWWHCASCPPCTLLAAACRGTSSRYAHGTIFGRPLGAHCAPSAPKTFYYITVKVHRSCEDLPAINCYNLKTEDVTITLWSTNSRHVLCSFYCII